MRLTFGRLLVWLVLVSLIWVGGVWIVQQDQAQKWLVEKQLVTRIEGIDEVYFTDSSRLPFLLTSELRDVSVSIVNSSEFAKEYLVSLRMDVGRGMLEVRSRRLALDSGEMGEVLLGFAVSKDVVEKGERLRMVVYVNDVEYLHFWLEPIVLEELNASGSAELEEIVVEDFEN